MIEYRIKSVGGYAEKIGELVSMLEYSRAVTLDEVRGLVQKDLDFLTNKSSNTIGAILLHIASIEFVHQVISFDERDINEVELQKWKTALELGQQARSEIRKNDIEHYLTELAQVREQTLATLKDFSDEWLFAEKQWENGIPYNNYYLWFHVLEDEINHRGQIRAIKRVLSESK
ncbi:DinB family protein [Virgibacillus siamensis]|uniref:DinB family protein n=1 Tax=Virgibacillus siamensis TaxID=480071 RepID=A0ABN1G5V8_9BACI